MYCMLETNIFIPTILGLRVLKGSMNFVNNSTRLWNVLLLNIDVNVVITTLKHNIILRHIYYITLLD